MMDVLIYGVPSILLFVYFVVKRLISRSYHRGWMDGFGDAIVIIETADDVCEQLAEIISEVGDAD